MSSNLRDDYDASKREVDLYFGLLRMIDGGRVVFDGDSSEKDEDPQAGRRLSEWERLLKAGAFLVLYNFVEATIRRAFESIYEGIETTVEHVGELSDPWMLAWLDRELKQSRRDDSLAKKLREAILGKRRPTFRNQSRFKSNLDAKQIHEIFHDHGTPMPEELFRIEAGALETIRRARNRLAHGEVGFDEGGRLVTVADLERIKDRTFEYLEGVLNHVEEILAGKSFKR